MRSLLASLAFLTALLLAGGGVAQTAPDAPPRIYAGKLTVVQWPLLEIDGKRIYASPGARIINANKLTVTPNMVAPGTRVTYELDGQGQIRTIRIAAP
jgi:hypothetical protein